MEFHIEPHLIRACLPAMHKDESIEYLACVHIREVGGKLVYEATNGHALIRIASALDQEYDCHGLDIMVPGFFATELAKPSFLKGYGVIGVEYLVAVISGQTITLEMPNGIASNRLAEGVFPNIDAVMPKHRRGTRALDILALDLAYLSAITASAKIFRNSQTEIAISDGIGAPIYFRKDFDGKIWEAVLVPVGMP